jgi:hypothetical protein
MRYANATNQLPPKCCTLILGQYGYGHHCKAESRRNGYGPKGDPHGQPPYIVRRVSTQSPRFWFNGTNPKKAIHVFKLGHCPLCAKSGLMHCNKAR